MKEGRKRDEEKGKRRELKERVKGNICEKKGEIGKGKSRVRI